MLETNKNNKDKFIEKIISNLEKVSSNDWESYTIPETVPMNLFTKVPYSGFNVMSLYLNTLANNYTTNYYATFKAIRDAGGRLRKGCKGAMVKFYKLSLKHKLTKKTISLDYYNTLSDAQKDTYNKFATVKHYTLFNADSIENIEDINVDFTYNVDEKKEFENNSLCESFIHNLITNGNLELRTEQENVLAFYHSKEDFVSIPKKDYFKDSKHYYSTLFHEVIHWTGPRLKRPMKGYREDKSLYSDEELIAEMGAMLLCLQYGINEQILNSIKYLKSWIGKTKKEDYYEKLAISFQESKKAKKFLETINK